MINRDFRNQKFRTTFQNRIVEPLNEEVLHVDLEATIVGQYLSIWIIDNPQKASLPQEIVV